MHIKRFGLGVAVLAALAFSVFAAPAAAAGYVGQPTWLADPSGVCSYPGRSACPLVVSQEPLPYGGAQVTAASGVVAAGTAAATLTSAAAQTMYLTGFAITGGGATGASLVTCTITGLIGGTASYIVAVPAGVTLGIVPVSRHFTNPVAASAVNTNIVVSCPTFGVGNTAASVNAEGILR